VPFRSDPLFLFAGSHFWLSVAIIATLIIGGIGTIVPLRIGIKAFQRMKF
jgi:ABC-2 type transport system permease protein